MEKTILIWDDNENILYTMEQICKFQKWNPLLASDFKEAERYLKKTSIDLVIVDYHMPDMNGITAVKEIRKILPTVPVIVLTIEETEGIMEKFMKAGADDYALKPVKAIDLVSRIKAHLTFAEKSQYYEKNEKGIGAVTLKQIEDVMKGLEEYKGIEELTELTGIKRKTLYRYLQYLQKDGRIDIQNVYASVGRPRQVYFWKK